MLSVTLTGTHNKLSSLSIQTLVCYWLPSNPLSWRCIESYIFSLDHQVDICVTGCVAPCSSNSVVTTSSGWVRACMCECVYRLMVQGPPSKQMGAHKNRVHNLSFLWRLWLWELWQQCSVFKTAWCFCRAAAENFKETSSCAYSPSPYIIPFLSWGRYPLTSLNGCCSRNFQTVNSH